MICVVCLVAAGCRFDTGAAGATADAPDHDGTPGCDPTWYDGAWHTRQQITIDHTKVAGDLQGYPLLIDLSLVGAQTTGADLLFTAADGLTRLPHDLDTFDGASGHAIAWVRIPTLSSTTDTVIYIYYANPTAPSQQDAPAVWTDYAAVWHLREDPAATAPQIADSSGHAVDATSRGTMPTAAQIPGKIGGSLRFDGIDDGLDVPSTTVAATFSYEAWIRKATGANWRCVLDNDPSYDRWFGTTDAQLSFWDGSSNIVTSNLILDTWYQLVATYDGTRVRIYRNGAPLGSPFTKTYTAVTNTMQIGYTSVAVGEYFPGQLDEIRISSVARSAAYIATSYRNQNAPATFATAATAETCP